MRKILCFLVTVIMISVLTAQNKNDQIRILTYRVDSLKGIISVKTQQIDAKQAQIYSWQQEVIAYKDKLATAQKSIQEMNDQVAVLRDSVKILVRQNQELSAANNALSVVQPATNEKQNKEKPDQKTGEVKEKSKVGLTWASENLKVSSFKNGDTIPQAKSDAEWLSAGNENEPAWCYYNYDPANDALYGKLYNWYAVNDPRGLAPDGWHIPTATEWNKLADAFGGDAGKKMKSVTGWTAFKGRQGNGTNASGFNGFPGGLRYGDGTFSYAGSGGYWWTLTENKDGRIHHRALYNTSNNVIKNFSNKQNGLSVRCVKD